MSLREVVVEYLKVPVSAFRTVWNCTTTNNNNVQAWYMPCNPIAHEEIAIAQPAHKLCGWVHRADMTPEAYREALNVQDRVA